jgi:hypothetical protein
MPGKPLFLVIPAEVPARECRVIILGTSLAAECNNQMPKFTTSCDRKPNSRQIWQAIVTYSQSYASAGANEDEN